MFWCVAQPALPVPTHFLVEAVAARPIWLVVLVSVPPSEIVKTPVAVFPIIAVADSAPTLVISGALTVVSIVASTTAVGTPPLQFPALNQSLSTAPVQAAA